MDINESVSSVPENTYRLKNSSRHLAAVPCNVWPRRRSTLHTRTELIVITDSDFTLLPFSSVFLLQPSRFLVEEIYFLSCFSPSLVVEYEISSCIYFITFTDVPLDQVGLSL